LQQSPSAHSELSIGAKVVLADADPRTLNMDPIMRLARKHNITVIEDAAHAFDGWSTVQEFDVTTSTCVAILIRCGVLLSQDRHLN
jgi:dTDP-4-amino-4,6-dideoxygalactose transaminase